MHDGAYCAYLRYPKAPCVLRYVALVLRLFDCHLTLILLVYEVDVISLSRAYHTLVCEWHYI